MYTPYWTRLDFTSIGEDTSLYTNELNFENMFSFGSVSIQPEWVKGKLAIEKDVDNNLGNSIVLIDPETNEEEVVLTAEQMKDWAMQDWKFSPDGNKLLFVTFKRQIYRHSFLANYAVYDIIKKYVAVAYASFITYA